METDRKLIKDLTPEIEKTSFSWYITFIVFLAFLGDNFLPVIFAGQTEVQRPHSVHARESK